MTREELERRLEAAEKQNLGLLDEIKNLKAKLAEMQDETEIPDFPKFKCGESYWTMYDNFVLSDERAAIIRARDATEYNMFHTEAYAQEFSDKCKLIAMLLHCKWYVDRDYIPDWNNKSQDEGKWQVFWSNMYKRYEVCDWISEEYGSVFFSTEEAAQKCAEWMNEHWKESTEVGDTDEV